MPTFTVTARGQEYDVEASSEAVAAQAVARMLQSSQAPVEQTGMLEKPIEFQARPSEEVKASLSGLPEPELAAELLKIKSPQGGAPTESNVQAMSGTLERTGSIRDVLNKEIASGALSPTATLDPQQYPVLAPIWEQYKQEMEPSMLGAAARGAVSQVGPTAGD